tara:strand:- start:318 stop:950 length:633 start_codon:yes stop_codon:yes gene_type:complete
MATNNAPRGLVLAKKNGDGSNSTGIRTIDLNPASPLVASALIPSDIFTGDPIMIESSGTIKPCATKTSVRAAGVFQGCSFVNASGEQKFARSITGGVTATDVKIHIASDPDQTFFIQSNIGVTTSANPIGVGVWNVPWVAGTGSHKTGQSGYTMDGDGNILTITNLRVIRRAPWDTGTSTSAGITDTYPWYEVRINTHMDNFISASVSGS